MAMAEGVITQRVPFGRDTPGQLRRALRLSPDRKERRMHSRCGEQIQNSRRPLSIGTIVEGQIDWIKRCC